MIEGIELTLVAGDYRVAEQHTYLHPEYRRLAELTFGTPVHWIGPVSAKKLHFELDKIIQHINKLIEIKQKNGK